VTDPVAGVNAFSLRNVLFAAIGASVFWGKTGRTALRAYVLSELVDLTGVTGKWRHAAEFLIFVILGCIVGLAVVDPRTAVQALTAGFAWTGVFSHPSKAVRR